MVSMTKRVRTKLWHDIRYISSSINEAWIITGDFNAIMDIEDRVGGALVRMYDIQDMKTCMQACNLSTHKTNGMHSTWNNKHEGEARVF